MPSNMGNTVGNSDDKWCNEPPQWEKLSDYTNILLKSATEPSAIVKISEILENSRSFPTKFPVQSPRCQQLQEKFPQETLEKNINSVYPIIHEKALYLCSKFLAEKRKFGSQIEKDLYQNLSLTEFIDRLLSKRAVMFVGARDRYILLDGTNGQGSWQTIGTPDEKPPLILKNCLSYDEIKLSAFLSVSSHTVFINDGRRRNCAIFEEDRTKIQDGGIIIGLIGPRMVENVMEHQEIIKSKSQNTQRNGYGKFSSPTSRGLFLHFYGDICESYETLKESRYFKDKNRFIEIFDDMYFDKMIYERRISISIDTLLLEANERAKNENKMAFVHVVGIGLGVWKIYKGQDKLFMEAVAKRLEFLGKNLQNVSDVCLAYINHDSVGKYKTGATIPIQGHPLTGITVHIQNREPHEKLMDDHKNKLLVVSYAWDGNSLPGNEFWSGSLKTSSDPAAACSTQVAELHNWHINPKKVCGGNLKVATLNGGVLSFDDYQKYIDLVPK